MIDYTGNGFVWTKLFKNAILNVLLFHFQFEFIFLFRKKVLHRLHNSFVHNTEINRAVAEVKTQIGDKQKIKEDETNYVNSLKMLVEENIVL